MSMFSKKLFLRRAALVGLLLLFAPLAAWPEPLKVGDALIEPGDFAPGRPPGQRIEKCLVCHGQRAGGDIDFGPETHFGTPALRGLGAIYLRDSLRAYREGTRSHEEMSVVAGMLDDETIDFMAETFSAFQVPPRKSGTVLESLRKSDPLFRRGEEIARRGIQDPGIPPCMSCHGPRGEGMEALGPRLAGQNALYLENQLQVFAAGERRTPRSGLMDPVAKGLSVGDASAVAHYYASLVVQPAGGKGAEPGIVLPNRKLPIMTARPD